MLLSFPLDNSSQFLVDDIFKHNPDLNVPENLKAFIDLRLTDSSNNWRKFFESGYSDFPLMQWNSMFGYVPWDGFITENVIIYQVDQGWIPVQSKDVQRGKDSRLRTESGRRSYTFSNIATSVSNRGYVSWPFLWLTRPTELLGSSSPPITRKIPEPKSKVQPKNNNNNGVWILVTGLVFSTYLLMK
jgi:hypothetical protein